MKIENAKVTLTFSEPNELLEGMDEEELLEFYQSLSCHDEVIKYVMQQVFEGCTESGYSGAESCSWNGNSELQKFKKKLIEITSDRAVKERVGMLERHCKMLEDRCYRLADEVDNLKRIKP